MANFESGKRTTLSQPVAPADTTLYLASAPTATSGRLYLKNDAQEERIDYTGVSGNTVTGCSRGMSQTADPSTSGTGLTWIAGTEVRLVAMHDQLANKLKANTWAAAQTFNAGIIPTAYASTAARDAALGGDGVATQNYLGIKAGAAYYNYNLSTSQREIQDTGTTPPDMTEAVAGIAEYTTDAEAIGGVDNNGSNALVPKPSDIHNVGAYFGQNSATYNFTIVPSRAAGAETIALKTKAGTDPSATDPIYIGFRNVTAGTGDWTYLTITAAESVVIPSTATMGASNSVPFRLWLVGINDGGTFRLGIVNTQTTAGIMALDDDLLLSSTTIGTGSDNAGVIYSDSGVTTKAIRLLGYLDYTLATAGTRDTAPSKIQLFGPGIKKPGDIVQIATTAYTSADSTATAMPYDNTIPQNTEGKEFMSQAITPTSAANTLSIAIQLVSANTGSQNQIIALFQDSTANALSATSQTSVSTGNQMQHYMSYSMKANTTSATTFKVRGGSPAGTFTFNGSAGAQRFGGVCTSSITVTEIMV